MRKTAALISSLLSVSACSLTQTRPVQEMSDAQAALRAAREVQADTLAPELFRQASEWHLKARNEYQLKNFDLAKRYADRARRHAEDAELNALTNGGKRASASGASSGTQASP